MCEAWRSYIYEYDIPFSDESEHGLEEDATSYASDRLACNGDQSASIRRNEDCQKPMSFTVRMYRLRSHLHILAALLRCAIKDKCEICISDLNSLT